MRSSDYGRASRRSLESAEVSTGASAGAEDWGYLGSPPRPKKRLYMRRIFLYRPGEEDLILVTTLSESASLPAVDLLEVYLNRCGIERLFQNPTSSSGTCRILSVRVETAAQFLEDGSHRFELGPVVDLARIVALVEELLAAIAVVANVDEVAFGQ
jgi:hypothetical protein